MGMTRCELGETKPRTGVGACEVCAARTYARVIGATKCNECPKGGNCTGGYRVWPQAGYWEMYIPENGPEQCREFKKSLVRTYPNVGPDDPLSQDYMQDPACNPFIAETNGGRPAPRMYKCQRK